MAAADRTQVVERIHASATPLVIAITGGGSGALSALLQLPGASATVLEAVVPYSAAALSDWLGGQPDQAASEATARTMAMAAFQRARRLSAADPRTLRGIGATASLATTRPKRGPHRIHVAWQSADRTVAISCELEKGARTRGEEEELATNLVLSAVAEACGVDAGSGERRVFGGCKEFPRREKHAPPEWTELLLGQRLVVYLSAQASQHTLVFPGAFHPVHAAHEKMAAIASQRYGAPVTWELSIANVDKPPLDFIEIADRLAGLAGRDVLLSRAPTFVEKAALFLGCTFVVGADTIVRIGETRYYGDDLLSRDAAVAAIAARGCRFLVFGRVVGGQFRALADLALPPALRALCEDVPESEYRDDISSTTIRASAIASDPRD